MKTLMFAAALFLSSQTAFAVLSPFNQSIVEFRTILESPELTKRVTQGQAITGIVRNPSGYLLTTSESEMQIDLEYIRQPHPGPARFNLTFHDPVPRAK